jgi:NAD(P)-dependent dehydrogenase (short-subunit alcohol dehydrogenase family)
VLITGAARGIGAALARRVVARGGRVALLGLEPERLHALAEDLGGDAAAFPADVRLADELRGAVASAVGRFGAVDVVVANAGVATAGLFADVPAAEFESTVDVNLLGVFRTLHATLDQLIARRGYALLVASLAAPVPPPLLSAYAASKAGVEALGVSLRVEMATRGVGIGVAYFGWVDTDLVRTATSNNRFFGELIRRSGLPTISADAAAGAMLRGIEGRARRVVAPKIIWPMILGSRVIRPLIDIPGRQLARQALHSGASSGLQLPPLGAGPTSPEVLPIPSEVER